jgi:hypothetical protein
MTGVNKSSATNLVLVVLYLYVYYVVTVLTMFPMKSQLCSLLRDNLMFIVANDHVFAVVVSNPALAISTCNHVCACITYKTKGLPTL